MKVKGILAIIVVRCSKQFSLNNIMNLNTLVCIDSPAPSVIKDSTTKVSMNSTFQTVKYRRSGFSRTCFRFVILLLGMKSCVVVIY